MEQCIYGLSDDCDPKNKKKSNKNGGETLTRCLPATSKEQI